MRRLIAITLVLLGGCLSAGSFVSAQTLPHVVVVRGAATFGRPQISGARTNMHHEQPLSWSQLKMALKTIPGISLGPSVFDSPSPASVETLDTGHPTGTAFEIVTATDATVNFYATGPPGVDFDGLRQDGTRGSLKLFTRGTASGKYLLDFLVFGPGSPLDVFANDQLLETVQPQGTDIVVYLDVDQTKWPTIRIESNNWWTFGSVTITKLP